MDFIEQLPPSSGFSAIFVVVDRLSKQAIFMPTTDKINSEGVARLFLTNVFAKHGVPSHVSSDRGSEFVSHFFRSLGTILDMKLHFTSGHHPEANGQVERVNQSLEQYLRHYTNYQQTDWSDLLPLPEFAYNNTPNESTGISPFFANKGYDPRLEIHPERDIASLRARDFAVNLEELHEVLRTQISAAQKRYSDSANSRRESPPIFSPGDKVYVSADHIRTTRPTRKLSERFLGPFEVLTKVSNQSYSIRLSQDLRGVHPVFHVSQLEPYSENTIPNRVQSPPPPVEIDGELEWEVEAILDSKRDKRYRSCPLRYLVKWVGYEGSSEEQTWTPAVDLENAAELVEAFHAQHPDRTGTYAEFQALFS